MNRIVQFFASIKLTLIMIVVVIVLSAIGTFFPQAGQSSQIIEIYNQQTYDVLHALGITDTYHSWWFLLSLVIVFLNLAACTAVRLPKVWKLRQRGSKADLADDSIPKTRNEEEYESSLSPEIAAQRAEEVLSKYFGKIRKVEGEDAIVLSAEKHGLALWGAYITHLGLFMLLIAGGMKVLFGYNLDMAVLEGEEEKVPRIQTDFGFRVERWKIPGTSYALRVPKFYERRAAWEDYTVALDRFEIKYYDTGLPRLFRSDFRLMRGKKEIDAVSIEVNHPFEKDGVRLYQASWGYQGLRRAEFDITLPNGDKYEVLATYKKRFKIEDTGWEVEITNFYPEASMEGPGKIVLAGYQLENPAIRIRLHKDGKEVAHFWQVLRYKEIQMSKIKGLTVVGKTVDPIAFSVIQVAYDPGIPLALMGALIAILGVFSAFYLYFRKFWVQVRPREQGCSIRLAGISKRQRLDFEAFFEQVAADLRAQTRK